MKSKSDDDIPCTMSFDLVDGISHPMSSDHVSCPRVMMACHGRRVGLCARSKQYVGIPSLDIVIPCVLSKSDDGIP